MMQENGTWEKINESLNDVLKLKEPVLELSVGEKINIKGEEFYVRKITKKDVILRSVRMKKNAVKGR